MNSVEALPHAEGAQHRCAQWDPSLTAQQSQISVLKITKHTLNVVGLNRNWTTAK